MIEQHQHHHVTTPMSPRWADHNTVWSGNYRERLPSHRRVSMVTWNLWRLREAHRVAPIVQALAHIGRDLGVHSDNNTLPDILCFQELESDHTRSLLAQALASEHTFLHYICATDRNGQTRSAVGIAFRHTRWRLVQTKELTLGRLWPDHPRGALVVYLQSIHAPTDPIIKVVCVHLSVRLPNHPQAIVLQQVLEQQQLWRDPYTLILGDFNTWDTTRTYATLTQPPIRDIYNHNRGRTHWITGRIDYLFAGSGYCLERDLHRPLAITLTRPAHALTLARNCQEEFTDQCPLSDHLPEGAVLGF